MRGALSIRASILSILLTVLQAIVSSSYPHKQGPSDLPGILGRDLPTGKAASCPSSPCRRWSSSLSATAPAYLNNQGETPTIEDDRHCQRLARRGEPNQEPVCCGRVAPSAPGLLVRIHLKAHGNRCGEGRSRSSGCLLCPGFPSDYSHCLPGLVNNGTRTKNATPQRPPPLTIRITSAALVVPCVPKLIIRIPFQ